MGAKHGDTLIEVTLAIGIFSLIAVAVVSVVSTSTSSAQIALESTLTREEIDAQAEALRFIQSSYVNSKVYSEDSENSDYTDIWHTITAHAKSKGSITDDVVKFQPGTCDEIYSENNLSNQGAFIINTRKLSTLETEEVVLYAKDSKVFYPSPTYPHLIFGMSADDDPLLDGDMDDDSSLTRAEGIHIVAVKDPDSTYIVDGEERNVKRTAAFYDFYIRACWYAPGAEQPTTVSTVIRLYDPDSIEVVWPDDPGGGGGSTPIPDDDPEDPMAVCRVNTRPTTLQSYTRAYCARCATDEPVSLSDTRDGKNYNVRYINGNCWMTSNLAITGSIGAEGSNFTGMDVNVSTRDLTVGDSYTEPRSHVGANGVWYNFAAASAKSITGERRTEYETPKDICPSGWKLPSKTQALALNAHLLEFAPTTGGFYGGGALQNVSTGYYWNSTIENGAGRFTFNYGDVSEGGLNRQYGAFIRCVMK